MTDRTMYYQRRNTASRKHGGRFHCPGCGAGLEINLTSYYCPTDNWTWDVDGNPVSNGDAS